MKAVSCRQGRLAVLERPTPQPGKGQVLIDVQHWSRSALSTATPFTAS